MKVSELIEELKLYEGCEGFPDTDPYAFQEEEERDVVIKTMRTKTIPQYHLEYEIYVHYGDVVINTVKTDGCEVK
tara:strand:+ start:199 stop:423 length:225 start_codon:yes stop_codon:yes gene_type:complete